jgi:hypothetical protein
MISKKTRKKIIKEEIEIIVCDICDIEICEIKDGYYDLSLKEIGRLSTGKPGKNYFFCEECLEKLVKDLNLKPIE